MIALQEKPRETQNSACMAPIFILGISYRSGTNFLYDLLDLHPDCEAAGVIKEDFLVNYADLLVKYAKVVQGRWNRDWQVRERMGQPDDLLCQCLGDGLITFLNLQPSQEYLVQSLSEHSPSRHKPSQKRLVTKTPSVTNLQHFFKLFPNAYLIIVVRDGRDLTESGVKSFNWSYEKAMHTWADAARTIIQFDQDNHNTDHKYLIVKYEDLYSDTEQELRKIFAFLNLDASKYDFEAATSLPVRGSSDLRKQGEKHIHWEPVQKTQSFNPVKRWSHWGRAKHERFNWLGGDYLARFGYSKQVFPGSKFPWIAWNIALDMKWSLRTGIRWLVRTVLRKPLY